MNPSDQAPFEQLKQLAQMFKDGHNEQQDDPLDQKDPPTTDAHLNAHLKTFAEEDYLPNIMQVTCTE